MASKLVSSILLVFAASMAGAQQQSPSAADRLIRMINDYRVEQGLHAIPRSRSLMHVAEVHLRDLEQNPRRKECNLHSWSSSGAWKPCCYTEDHAQRQCMWDKPREITGGKYRGDGFEISSWNSGRHSPELALSRWKLSPGHHDVILNKERWATAHWNAIGAAVSDHHVLVWFGKDVDTSASD